jgi:hypothetical protein
VTATATAPVRSSQTFAGFYLRDNLGDQGTIPAPGPYALSPDIIGSTEPIPDAESELSTQQSWKQMYSVEPTPGVENYYYVRGLNGDADPVDDTLALYWSLSNLIMFPSVWKGNEIPPAAGTAPVTVSAASGHIGVGDGAFLWARPPVLDDPGDFIAFVATVSETDAPEPFPVINSWLDVSALLTQRLDLGFRNTARVEAGEDSWYRRLHLDIPPGLPSGRVVLSVMTKGFVGNTLGFIGDLFSPQREPIMLLPTQVTQDGASSTITVTLEGGLSTSLALQFWQTGNAPAAGATVTFSADYVVPDSQLAEAGSRALVHARRSRFLAEQAGIGPTAMAPLGSATFIVG